ncbi:MAG: hypothetical protein L6R30_21745, partial [Thermoanaerobaculia bacterium]|nr:hypothetical protein [Thermoanaerobaculia bacterium]
GARPVRTRPPRRPPDPRLVSDAAPSSLLRELRAKPMPPLPKGPYPVPVSTFDWLLGPESPAVRYVALRDLLGRPEKDIDLRKARRALLTDPLLRDALPLLRQALHPGWSSEDLERRYEGALWLSLFLLESGGDADVPEMQKTRDVLLARWERTFVEIERGERPEVDPAVFSISLRVLCGLGMAGDPRVASALEFAASERIGSPSSPEASLTAATQDLLLFASVPAASRTTLVQKAMEFATERLLQTAFTEERLKNLPDFRFPAAGEFDVLEVLLGLARAGVHRRPALNLALRTVHAKADHRSRWKAGPPLPDPTRFPLEPAGEFSRWVTLRALIVMQHFFGLTIR